MNWVTVKMRALFINLLGGKSNKTIMTLIALKMLMHLS